MASSQFKLQVDVMSNIYLEICWSGVDTILMQLGDLSFAAV